MMRSAIHFVLDFFYPIFQRFFPYDVYAYLTVGAFNTALNIILFAFFYHYVLPTEGLHVFGMSIASYTVSLVIAFIATVPTGFWLAKHFAFKSTTDPGKSIKQLGKYFLVVLQGLGSDYLLLVGFILFVGIQPTLAKILSTIFVLGVNFLLQKYFTFQIKPVESN